MSMRRAPRSGETMMVPEYAAREGCVLVNATWGTIQPLQLAPGVLTVGELEVIEHCEAGLPLVDTRRIEQHEQATIPGAHPIPHQEILQRIDELDRERVTVLFCNGPQCAATPHAVEALLGAGYPAGKLRYYRGGIHDWMTLGLPIAGSRAEESADG
jgi:rhodanese-related sulfurtransferase